jgi:aspartokinase/homoserine dehydrogenase 1
MPQRLSIVQLGKGTVGSALIDQVAAQRPALRERLGVDLIYAGIAGRTRGVLEPRGVDLKRWRAALRSGDGAGGRQLLRRALGSISGPAVLVDATAEEGMADLYLEAVAGGFHLVSCNKKPLAGPLADYRRVRDACRRKRRFWLHEVTVGAGLPVIGTLRDLLDGGDRLESIEGCFSGTLNFLCAALDGGEGLSRAVARARDLGYTEPDPREDLGGGDVARKALILARAAGLELEPEEVEVEPFCPVDADGDVDAFLRRLPAQDAPLARRWRDAAARHRRWRYVARVGRGCAAGPAEVPADSALGRLGGPENVFVFRTARYRDFPLVVSGPGAGPQVTAAGAFADIIRVARAVAQTS